MGLCYDRRMTTVDRRRLPIGIQTFRNLRDDGCYYVDKTALIHQMIDQGRYYFLSRPRRFGKSLLLDTLHELFEGNEALFRGLAIHPHWNWDADQQHPVIRISFGGKYNEPGELEGDIIGQLENIEMHYDLAPATTAYTAPQRLRNLLFRLHRQTGRDVVVLIDEYDKPILDVLEAPDLAKANRDYLRGFYGILKDSARDIRFVFLTGISMFSNVNLFSGLNNLENISLDPRYSTLCGYTDHDLDTVFAAELPGLDRDEIRRWYNGYRWLGEETVYNPFDVLLLFRGRKFEPYWFRTGTPTFLYRELVRKGVSALDLVHRTADRELVSTFDITDHNIDALLFQTGYLTIIEEEQRGSQTRYRLDYPNQEVELSLNQGLLRYMTEDPDADETGAQLLKLLAAADFDGFADTLRAYLAGIPYPWHDQADLGRYESWYASLLYMGFKAIGAEVRVEEATRHGRSDLVLLHAGQVFVMEFKVVEDEGQADAALDRALMQIRDKGYSEKYRNQGKPIHHVAMVFGGKQRNLLELRVGRT